MIGNSVAFIEDDTADGGLGMVFRSLAGYLCQHYKVYYLSTRDNNGRIPESIQYIKYAERQAFQPHTNGIRRSLSGVLPLRNLLVSYKPDVAISFGFYSNIRLCQAARGIPVKVLISERGNAARFRGVYRLLLQILLGRTDKIVFQSEAARKAYPRLLQRKGVVINNAIFKESLPDSSEMAWDNRIVSVGRIHPDKNFPLLLRAFEKVSKNFPDYKLVIYGEEEPGSPQPYLEQLKELADELGIAQKVDFAGHSEAVGQAIMGARLFVLSSVLEGMPNALIEAMACGLPCITTDFFPGCACEIVEEGKSGLISDRENADVLADKMCTLLSDEALSRELARNALQIRKRLSKEIIFEKWKREVSELVRS